MRIYLHNKNFTKRSTSHEKNKKGARFYLQSEKFKKNPSPLQLNSLVSRNVSFLVVLSYECERLTQY